MNQRLPKSERIRRRADYLRIQDRGQKIHTPSFVCFSLRAPAAAIAVEDSAVRPLGVGVAVEPSVAVAASSRPARIGITVSRRVGGAVVRNRVKRLVKEAFRRHKSELPPDVELVMIARASAATIQLVQIERELADVTRRLPSSRSRHERSRRSPSDQ